MTSDIVTGFSKGSFISSGISDFNKNVISDVKPVTNCCRSVSEMLINSNDKHQVTRSSFPNQTEILDHKIGYHAERYGF